VSQSLSQTSRTAWKDRRQKQSCAQNICVAAAVRAAHATTFLRTSFRQCHGSINFRGQEVPSSVGREYARTDTKPDLRESAGFAKWQQDTTANPQSRTMDGFSPRATGRAYCEYFAAFQTSRVKKHQSRWMQKTKNAGETKTTTPTPSSASSTIAATAATTRSRDKHPPSFNSDQCNHSNRSWSS